MLEEKAGTEQNKNSLLKNYAVCEIMREQYMKWIGFLIK